MLSHNYPKRFFVVIVVVVFYVFIGYISWLKSRSLGSKPVLLLGSGNSPLLLEYSLFIIHGIISTSQISMAKRVRD